MKRLTKLFVLATFMLSANAFADHRIEELQGQWFSTLWPNGNEFYEFTGLKPEGSNYIFQQTRNEAAGICVGSGVINLETGKVLSIEICPPTNGRERVFVNEWTIVIEHDKYHLRGGYYGKGSSNFAVENLDKKLHGDDGDSDDGDDGDHNH